MEAIFYLCEIHTTHVFLLHEFLSPLSNTRTDRHGASLWNRTQMLLETIDSVKAELGPGANLLVRFSAAGWVEGG